MKTNRSIKKLVIFTDSYPYGNNSEPFFEKEINYLNKRFSCISIVPLYGGRKVRKVSDNVKVYKPIYSSYKELVFRGLKSSFLNMIMLNELIANKVYLKKKWLKSYLIATLTIRAIHKRNDINDLFNNDSIFYFYWGRGFSYYIPFINSVKKKTIISRFHGYDINIERANGYLPYHKKIVSNIKCAIFISNQGKDLFSKINLNIDIIKKVFRLGTIDYGIKINDVSKTLRLLTCSNLYSLKRVDILLKTLLDVHEINVLYYCIGDGVDREKLEAIAQELPDNIKVKFLGSLPNAEVMKFYKEKEIDLFINLSLFEGLPVSIMEAMSFGIPVVATNIGGTSEIVNVHNGFLLNANFSREELKNILIGYYKLSANEKNNYKLNARKIWEECYNAENNYETFVNFIANL